MYKQGPDYSELNFMNHKSGGISMGPGAKFEQHGKEVRILTPDELQRFMGENGEPLENAKKHFEDEYPGYHFPDEKYVNWLFTDREELNKLTGGAEVSELNILTYTEGEEGGFTRREMRKQNGKWEEVNEGVNTSEKKKRHIEPTDLVFMVKNH